jgi:hypothetical protein
MNRVEHIHVVTKRLITMTALSVLVMAVIFGLNFYLS